MICMCSTRLSRQFLTIDVGAGSRVHDFVLDPRNSSSISIAHKGLK